MVGEDLDRFRDRYTSSAHAAVMAAELEALGSDYRANGYTTLSQADAIGDALGLSPGDLLLDIGSGCGWPGLHLAERHACRVISLDPVVEGCRAARSRSIADGLGPRAAQLCAEAEAVPLRPGTVDAVIHGDLMC